ncbi:MAG: GyrI-like domain-containing protein [Bacteroidota bacterium]
MQKVTIDSFSLIGISIRTSNAHGQAGRDIPGLWTRFMAEDLLNAIPNKVDTTIYSLYTDYEGDHTKPYTAILGCKVQHLNQIPEGMVGQVFDGGNYIKMSARGDLMSGLVLNKWMEIWDMDLDRIFTADFEVFGEKAQNPADAEVDFMIAVT